MANLAGYKINVILPKVAHEYEGLHGRKDVPRTITVTTFLQSLGSNKTTECMYCVWWTTKMLIQFMGPHKTTAVAAILAF